MNRDLSRIKAVIFDFDGTLADTNELICDSWRHTVGKLTGGEITDDEIRSTFGEVLSHSLNRIMPDIDVEAAVAEYRKYQHDIYLERITLFEDSEAVLRALRKTGYKVALATSRLRSSTERGLNHFGIIDLFDVVLTADDTPIFKPDPTPILMTMDKLGVTAEQSIFVGDTTHDVEAGLAAGVFTILVDWSFALPEDKRDAVLPPGGRPHATIKKMTDILTLLDCPFEK